MKRWQQIFLLDCRFKAGHSSSDCLSVYHSKYRYGHPFAYIHVRCDRCSTIQRKILFLYRFFEGIWKILLGFFQTKQKWNECIQQIVHNKFGLHTKWMYSKCNECNEKNVFNSSHITNSAFHILGNWRRVPRNIHRLFCKYSNNTRNHYLSTTVPRLFNIEKYKSI